MDFEVNGVKFRAGKLNALDQFHVFRKLAPVVSAIGSLVEVIKPSLMKKLESGEEIPPSGLLGLPMETLTPVARAIADLPEADCNLILDKCLSLVERATETAVGTAWAPIWSRDAKRMMYDDLEDGIVMIQIAVQVIQGNIGNFSSAQSSR